MSSWRIKLNVIFGFSGIWNFIELSGGEKSRCVELCFITFSTTHNLYKILINVMYVVCCMLCVCVFVLAEVIDLCHNICPNKIHCNLFRWHKPCAIARVQRPGLPLCQVSKQVSSHNDGQQINLAASVCVSV